VVALIVKARAEGIAETLEQAASDLGAPPWRGCIDITLPAMFPAVLAGFPASSGSVSPRCSSVVGGRDRYFPQASLHGFAIACGMQKFDLYFVVIEQCTRRCRYVPIGRTRF
jgi:hypothetical protein